MTVEDNEKEYSWLMPEMHKQSVDQIMAKLGLLDYTGQAIEALKDFHTTFGLDINSKPTFIDTLSNFRVELIDEETKELDDALKDHDPVETLDALCDLQYVLSGAIIALGYEDVFNRGFQEVHRSNMSKACKTREEAEATVKLYTDKGEPCHITEKDDVFIVRRTSDGKILKSVNYSPADLTFMKETK